MLLRFDPFRELDRLASTEVRRPAISMDATRRGNEIVIELDLPGVRSEDIELTVERNVLAVTAERHRRSNDDAEVIASERVHGTFRREFHLGESLDTSRIDANHTNGVLTLTIPVAETAQPRRIEVGTSDVVDTDGKQLSA